MLQKSCKNMVKELEKWLIDAKKIQWYTYSIDEDENDILKNMMFLTFNTNTYYNNVVIDYENCLDFVPLKDTINQFDKTILLVHIGNMDNNYFSWVKSNKIFTMIFNTIEDNIPMNNYNKLCHIIYNEIKKNKSFIHVNRGDNID